MLAVERATVIKPYYRTASRETAANAMRKVAGAVGTFLDILDLNLDGE
ncbi:MAG: hypothetical protein ACLTSX_00080 [Collinsella sp.]